MTLRQRIIEQLNAHSHTEVFHGSGAQMSVALDKSIAIINAAFDEPVSKEDVERVGLAVKKEANLNWSRYMYDYESRAIAKAAIIAYLGRE